MTKLEKILELLECNMQDLVDIAKQENRRASDLEVLLKETNKQLSNAIAARKIIEADRDQISEELKSLKEQIQESRRESATQYREENRLREELNQSMVVTENHTNQHRLLRVAIEFQRGLCPCCGAFFVPLFNAVLSGHRCPKCDFSISNQEMSAVVSECRELMYTDLAVFQEWRKARMTKPKTDE